MTVKRIQSGKLEKIKIPTEYEGLTNVYFDAALKARVFVGTTQPVGNNVLSGSIWRNTTTNPHGWFMKMPDGSWTNITAGTVIGGIKQSGLITAAQNDLITSTAALVSAQTTTINNLQNDKLNKTSALAGGDWNDYKSPGYYDGMNLTNSPIMGEWLYVQVQSHSLNPGMWVVQKAIGFNSSRIFIRTLENGTWSPWYTSTLDENSSIPSYGCRAFAAHNPRTGITLKSKNISSIARVGVGRWKFTFTVPMPDANYCAVTSMNQEVFSNVSAALHTIIGALHTNYCDVIIAAGGNTSVGDLYADYISLAVFA